MPGFNLWVYPQTPGLQAQCFPPLTPFPLCEMGRVVGLGGGAGGWQTLHGWSAWLGKLLNACKVTPLTVRVASWDPILPSSRLRVGIPGRKGLCVQVGPWAPADHLLGKISA